MTIRKQHRVLGDIGSGVVVPNDPTRDLIDKPAVLLGEGGSLWQIVHNVHFTYDHSEFKNDLNVIGRAVLASSPHPALPPAVHPSLSPRALAEAIGVSESSLKRWADAGLLRTERTAGGHRRIPVAEAIRFIRAQGATVVRPELLGLVAAPASTQLGDDELLWHMLREGKARECRAWLVARYLDGQSVAALADGPIRSAMARLGELWHGDPRGVFIEHRATDCCVQAVAELRNLIDTPDDAPIAVGGGPAGDPYLLPSLLISSALAAEGIRAVNLGPNTPVDSLRHAVNVHHPIVVWLSCSAPVGRKLGDEIAQFASALPPTIAMVVGGQQVHTLGKGHSAHVLDSIAEVSSFVRGVVAAQRARAGA